MTADYDVVVIGAGPNGLTCAAYLGQAGARVAVLEKNIETGGGLVTQELSGFKLNHHATYMLLAEQMPPYADLALGDRGVAFVRPDAQAAFLFAGGASLVLYADPARSRESVARLSPADAEAFGRMQEEFAAMCDAFLIPATYALAAAPLEQVALLERADPLGRRINEISEMSAREVIASYGFRDGRVEAALLYLATMFGLDPDETGVGFLTPIYVHRLTQAALVRGGTHQLASALRRVVEDGGGEVLTRAEARELVIEDGAAAGVVLADGRELRARAVVSTLDPARTFAGLLGARAPSELRECAEIWQWDETSLFVQNLGVVGDPPRYAGWDAEVDRALIVVMGYERPDEVLSHFRDVREGRLPERIAGHGSCLSLHDPLLVPDHVPYGPHHVLRFECWAPYGADWAAQKSSYGARCFDFWCRHAPNLARSNVRARVDWSPRDIEVHLPTMVRGSIKHGAYVSLQMGYNRPGPDCSRHRTPVRGLYVAGASVHPGGMVILGPGYNASRVVAGDLGLAFPWREPEMVRRARERGYLSPELSWGEPARR